MPEQGAPDFQVAEPRLRSCLLVDVGKSDGHELAGRLVDGWAVCLPTRRLGGTHFVEMVLLLRKMYPKLLRPQGTS